MEVGSSSHYEYNQYGRSPVMNRASPQAPGNFPSEGSHHRGYEGGHSSGGGVPNCEGGNQFGRDPNSGGGHNLHYQQHYGGRVSPQPSQGQYQLPHHSGPNPQQALGGRNQISPRPTPRPHHGSHHRGSEYTSGEDAAENLPPPVYYPPQHGSGGLGHQDWGSTAHYGSTPHLALAGVQSSHGVVHRPVQEEVRRHSPHHSRNQFSGGQQNFPVSPPHGVPGTSSHHSDTPLLPPPLANSTAAAASSNSVKSSVSSSGLDSMSSSTWSSSLDQKARQTQFRSGSLGSKSLEYQNVSIDRQRQLGSGAYGAVFHASCDQLECAAKIMHTALSAPGNENVQSALDKFKEEIELLSTIRHPNIVQYLTSTIEPGTGYPVLFMELCDESLTNYLEGTLPPYHEQINICFDVSVALSHLHGNKIYHRDLSSNNVLLKHGHAKVTDFGMSKIAEFRPNTLCPGNPVYMPPEALNEPPSYTDKLDVFSLGVLMVQIMTRKFPDPSNRFRIECIQRSLQFPEGKVHRPVPETTRRANHIGLIEGSHPLRLVALSCLNDKEESRPLASQLSFELKGMKSAPKFTQSLKVGHRSKTESHVTLSDHTRQLEQHVETLQKKLDQATNQIQSMKDSRDTLALTREQLKRMSRLFEEEKGKHNHTKKELEKMKYDEKNQQELLATFQKTLDSNAEEKRILSQDTEKLRQELKHKIMAVEEREREIADLKEQVYSLMKAKSAGGGATGRGGGGGGGGGGWEVGVRDLSRLRWEVMEQAPVNLSAGSAVTIGEDVFVASDTGRMVYCYSPTRKWTTLPEAPCEAFSLAVVDGSLVTVGGSDGDYSRKICAYDSRNRFWNDATFPPMPTARREPITLGTAQYLIVAGGFSGVRLLDTIEVMTLVDKKWTMCPCPLPHLVSGGSMALCDNQLYLAPIIVDSVNTQSLMLTCSLSDLFKLPRKRMFKQYPGHWQKTKDLPNPLSSIVALDGRILAVGGKSQDAPTYTVSSVWEYVPSSGAWKAVSKMNIGRWTAIVAALPRDRVIVMGGQSNWKKTNPVEIASL